MEGSDMILEDTRLLRRVSLVLCALGTLVFLTAPGRGGGTTIHVQDVLVLFGVLACLAVVALIVGAVLYLLNKKLSIFVSGPSVYRQAKVVELNLEYETRMTFDGEETVLCHYCTFELKDGELLRTTLSPEIHHYLSLGTTVYLEFVGKSFKKMWFRHPKRPPRKRKRR
jgi:hypothetical protein